MSDDFQKENAESTEKGEKLYTKSEVKTKKTISFIEGIVLGVIGLLTTGVVMSKVSDINLIDSADKVVDSGIDKVKSIPGRIKKRKEENAGTNYDKIGDDE
jgi:hypothetical protein